MKWKDVLEIWGKKEVTVVEIVSTTVTDLVAGAGFEPATSGL